METCDLPTNLGDAMGRLYEVWELHQPDPKAGDELLCVGCGRGAPWPCRTLLLVTGRPL